jgi:DNA-binding CsgD family transcriptional regulator
MSHQLRLPRPPTDRQLRVLFASKRLRSQKAAARELGISYQTVKNHLQSLYRRLGVDCIDGALAALGYELDLPEM